MHAKPGIGPLLGALLASAFYKLLKYLNYEEVNGTQDLTAEEEIDIEKAPHSGSAYPKRSKPKAKQQQQQQQQQSSSPPKQRSSTTPRSEKRFSGRSTGSTRTRVSREGTGTGSISGHYSSRGNRDTSRYYEDPIRYTNEPPVPPPKPSGGMASNPQYGNGETYVQDASAGGHGTRRKEAGDR